MTALTSEQTELQGRVQHMTEEMERLRSDLKHTSSARARAENREVEVRSSLTMVEGELREARDELQALQSELVEFQDGFSCTQSELQLAREELVVSRGERRDLQAELRAITNDLNNKEAKLEAARQEVSKSKMLLDTARHEHSEAAHSSERLGEECRGLRADLLQQIDTVAQRDEVIRQLRDQAGAQWASGWLAFQQKATRVYSDLDFDFDLPSDGKRRNPLARMDPQSLALLLRPLLALLRLILEIRGLSPLALSYFSSLCQAWSLLPVLTSF